MTIRDAFFSPGRRRLRSARPLFGEAVNNLVRCFCIGIAFGAAVFTAESCNVPVFRYALERWPAGTFTAYVFHHGPLGPDEQRSIDEFRALVETAHANVEVRPVDVQARLRRDEEKAWRSQTNAPLPWMLVRLEEEEAAPPVWAGRWSLAAAKSLIDSPARREIADRLLGGESAVWVLVDGGDRTQDEAAHALLTTELRKLEQTLELPPAAADDPQLQAMLPLRIAFSTLRIAANGPESIFARMLLQGEDVPPGKPVAFPIFGRGRALAALAGAHLSANIVQQAAAFVCGACSCEVKELNPGKDLLFAVNWDLVFRSAVERPSMAGTTVAIPAKREIAAAAPAEAADASPNRRRGMKLLAGTGLAISAIIVLLVGVILLRSLRQR